MFNLFEDNKSIDDLIRYINLKIVALRDSKNIPIDLLKELSIKYKSIVIPWSEEYELDNVEPDRKSEEQIKNDLLEIVIFLKEMEELPNQKEN